MRFERIFRIRRGRLYKWSTGIGSSELEAGSRMFACEVVVYAKTAA